MMVHRSQQKLDKIKWNSTQVW